MRAQVLRPLSGVSFPTKGAQTAAQMLIIIHVYEKDKETQQSTGEHSEILRISVPFLMWLL